MFRGPVYCILRNHYKTSCLGTFLAKKTKSDEICVASKYGDQVFFQSRGINVKVGGFNVLILRFMYWWLNHWVRIIFFHFLGTLQLGGLKVWLWKNKVLPPKEHPKTHINSHFIIKNMTSFEFLVGWVFCFEPNPTE